MIWVVICIVVAVAVAVGWLAWAKYVSPGEVNYPTGVALCVIRRQLDVSQYRLEVKRSAASVRREMRADLGRLDEKR